MSRGVEGGAVANPRPNRSEDGTRSAGRRVYRSRRRAGRRAERIAFASLVLAGVAAIPMASEAMYPTLTTAFDGARVVVEAVDVLIEPSDASDEYAELRRIAIDNADTLASGDTSLIPASVKNQLKERLSRDDQVRLRTWFQEYQPSADEIRSLATRR